MRKTWHRSIPSGIKKTFTELDFEPPKYIGKGLYAGVYTFTPKRCKTIKEQFEGPRARNMKTRQKTYCKDIENNAWLLNGTTIIFNKEGILHDGSNRVASVIASDKSITTVVIAGVEDDSSLTCDIGAARSPSQSLSMFYGKNINNLSSGVLNRIILGDKQKGANHTRQELADNYKAYEDAVTWSCGFFAHSLPKIRVSSVLGAIANASYHVPHSILEEFTVALRDGFISPDSTRIDMMKTIIKLRDHLQNIKDNTGRVVPVEMYMQVQRVIKAFVDLTPIKIFRNQTSGCYSAPASNMAKTMFNKMSKL